MSDLLVKVAEKSPEFLVMGWIVYQFLKERASDRRAFLASLDGLRADHRATKVSLEKHTETLGEVREALHNLPS